MLIDPVRFADEGRRQSGTLSLNRFSRLAEELVEPTGEVVFSLMGDRDRDGRRFISLLASTDLLLSCQRCLKPVVYPLEIKNRLWLVPKGRAIPDNELETDDFDAIEVDALQDILVLLEDEMLLALPMAPCHEACQGVHQQEGADVFSAFSGLAKLKK